MIEFKKSVIEAELGQTHLFSTGQAGFIIKTKTGKLIGIDLYLSDCVERVESDHVGYRRLLPKILSTDELVFDAIVIAIHPLPVHKSKTFESSFIYFNAFSTNTSVSGLGHKTSVLISIS